MSLEIGNKKRDTKAIKGFVDQPNGLFTDILYIDPALHYEDFRIIEHYIHDHLPSRCGININNEENADENR